MTFYGAHFPLGARPRSALKLAVSALAVEGAGPPAAPRQVPLTGTVLDAEPPGAESLIHLGMNGQTATVRQDRAQRIPEQGERVRLKGDYRQQQHYGPDRGRERA